MTIGINDQSFIAMGNTSSVTACGKGLVKKQLRDTKTAHRVNEVLKKYYPASIPHEPLIYHETSALIALEEYGISPKIVDIGNDFFVMTNVGKAVTCETKFKDLKSRINYIIHSLSAEKIIHNDLRRDFRNYTSLNGVLFLVDFQIADIGEVQPSNEIRKPEIKKGKIHYHDNVADLSWFYRQFEKGSIRYDRDC